MITKETGVYGILCTVSRKWYIGSTSVSFKHRWRTHKNELKRGVHHSQKLQRAWIKYGDSAFQFKVLEVTRPEWCLAVEQTFLDSWKTVKHGYNIAPIAGNSMRGRKHSAATIERIRVAKRNMSAAAREKIGAAARNRKVSAETRAKLSAAHKGKRFSFEHREKIALSKTGKTHSFESRAKIGAASRGRVYSAESRARMSEAGKKRIFSAEHRANLSAAGRRRHARKRMEKST